MTHGWCARREMLLRTSGMRITSRSYRDRRPTRADAVDAQPGTGPSFQCPPAFLNLVTDLKLVHSAHARFGVGNLDVDAASQNCVT